MKKKRGKEKISQTSQVRRDFLRKAGLALTALPILLKSEGLLINRARGETPKRTEKTDKNRSINKIDIEAHCSSEVEARMFQKFAAKSGFSSSLNTQQGVTGMALSRMADFEKFRLPAMDKAGVKVQLLSSGIGMQSIGDAAEAISYAQMCNDAQARNIGKYPGRFAGLASLPTQDPRAAADELERAVTKLGFKGGIVGGHTNGEYLDEKKFWVLWERAEALGVPIALHPMEPPLVLKQYFGTHSELMGPTWAWGVDTATHVLRIIGAGVLDAFPKTTIILGHMGESLPYLLDRLDEGSAMTFKSVKLKKQLSAYIRENVLVTTSGKYGPEALTCAVSALGFDRILFASDYPFVNPEEAVQLIERTPLSDSDKEKIYYLNAKKWLKLG